MITLPVYNLQGERSQDIKLSEEVFGVKANQDLLHQVYTTLYGNKRAPIAHTKDKSGRAGSGRKPWKQKGTGRARTGTVRNPIWRKGGVIFGPTNERNFKLNVNVKMKRKALLMAVSEKIREEKFFVIENFDFKDGKTKEFASFLQKLEIFQKSVLVGFGKQENDNAKTVRNVAKVAYAMTDNFNVLDVLNHQYIVVSRNSVEMFEEKNK